jgi:hypothetical protein
MSCRWNEEEIEIVVELKGKNLSSVIISDSLKSLGYDRSDGAVRSLCRRMEDKRVSKMDFGCLLEGMEDEFVPSDFHGEDCGGLEDSSSWNENEDDYEYEVDNSTTNEYIVDRIKEFLMSTDFKNVISSAVLEVMDEFYEEMAEANNEEE